MTNQRGTVIYGTKNCPACKSARALLDNRDIGYRYIDLADIGETAAGVTGIPSARSVPQIYVDSQYIGGFDELRLFFDNAGS